jgi:hypothetical protein
MRILYIIGGVALCGYGIWQSIVTTKVYIRGEQDKLGNDIKILGSAVMAIIIGLSLIIRYL